MVEISSFRRRAALLLLGATLATPLAAREKLTGEQQLAQILKDRVPGKPEDCISLSEARGTTIIPKTAIVYDAGRTIYVNRPAWPDNLDDDQVMVTRTWGSQLCRLDLVQLHGRGGMGWEGSVSLQQFVPYTKAPALETKMPAPASPPSP